MEEGLPLIEAGRAIMADADTVWLTPLDEILACLQRVGLTLRWQDDSSPPHRAMAGGAATDADGSELKLRLDSTRIGPAHDRSRTMW